MTAPTDGTARAAASPTTTEAVDYFSRRLRFAIDVSDAHAAMRAQDPGFVLVDSRGQAAWDQGHLPGAVHLPTAQIPALAPGRIPAGTSVVTYCWGPGCDGATRAALAFARLGYPVRELLGGYEYWVREGFAVRTPTGLITRMPDPLTAPGADPSCDC